MTNIVNVLNSVNGASFVGIDTRTTPTIRKTLDTDDGRVPNPHHGRITKLTSGASVMVFQNKNSNGYVNMISRRLLKEGKKPETFKLSPRTWGTRIDNLPLVEHKGQYYLEVIFLKPGTTTYLLDGQPIDQVDITGMSDSPSGEQGGLSEKVVIRTIKMSSISAMTINKETHTNLFCKFED